MTASTARKYGSQAMPRYMWTATKPLSRPAAVLIRASSAATVRTSIGNGTAKRARARPALDELEHAAHGLDGALARERVLHLGEAHEAGAREDAVGAIDAVAGAGEARDEPVDARDLRGQAAPEAAAELEGVVGEQDVVGVGRGAPAGTRGLVGAVVGARQRGRGVREDVELEVVVGERELVEALERLLQRRRPIDARPGGRPGRSAA